MTAVALMVGFGAQNAEAVEAKNAGAQKNIVQVATEAGSFKTLVAALKATDLVGALSGQGQGPVTVFAPTDEAFAKLPPGTVENLLANPAQLKRILLYHVVAGAVPASQVVGLSSAQTLNGQSVAISVANGTVYLNGTTKVTQTDVMARNGIIHVIDAVLIPNN
jgi:transforming growth factor-beta-induced protein